MCAKINGFEWSGESINIQTEDGVRIWIDFEEKEIMVLDKNNNQIDSCRLNKNENRWN